MRHPAVLLQVDKAHLTEELPRFEHGEGHLGPVLTLGDNLDLAAGDNIGGIDAIAL